MLSKQEFDTNLQEASLDYESRKEVRALLKKVTFDPAILASELFKEDSPEVHQSTTFLRIFKRLQEDAPQDGAHRLWVALTSLLNKQNEERVSKKPKEFGMIETDSERLTKPKVAHLSRAFALFSDLEAKYQKERGRKDLAKFLISNSREVDTIMQRREKRKHHAQQDGDHEELSELESAQEDFKGTNFFAHRLDRVKYIHSLYRNHHTSTIIETPYVREKIDEAMESLGGNSPQPVMLIWVHGAGKTELARHISRTRFGVDAIEIPGSEDLDQRDFEGRYTLQAADIEGFVQFLQNTGITQVQLGGKKQNINSDLVGRISADPHLRVALEDAVAAAFMNKEGVNEEEKKANLLRCREAVQDIYQSQVSTKFVFGRMAEAMRDGKPFIVDEANALKPAIWLALHSYLSVKPGDKVRINGDVISVKKWFCWLLTGNPPDQYTKGRNKFDIATLSRIKMIRYDYLPQESEDSLEAILEKSDPKTGLLEANELFTTMVISMMDSPLGVFLPWDESEDVPAGMRELFNLARLAREIQMRFQKINTTSPIVSATGWTLSTNIKEHTISPREIFGHILPYWKKSGFSQDLSYCLYFHFINSITDKKEQFEIYFLAQQMGFFTSDGWPDSRVLAQDQNARDTLDIGRLVSRSDLKEYERIEFKSPTTPSIWKLKNPYLPKVRFFSDHAIAKFLWGEGPEIDFEEYIKSVKSVDNVSPFEAFRTTAVYLAEQIEVVIAHIDTQQLNIEQMETAITHLTNIQNSLWKIKDYLENDPTENSTIASMSIEFDNIGENLVVLSQIEGMNSSEAITLMLAAIEKAKWASQA